MSLDSVHYLRPAMVPRSIAVVGASPRHGSLGRFVYTNVMAAGFKGTFALEYEAGPLNGVEGAKYLYREVLAALTKAETV